jgi:hypothetical protein
VDNPYSNFAMKELTCVRTFVLVRLAGAQSRHLV